MSTVACMLLTLCERCYVVPRDLHVCGIEEREQLRCSRPFDVQHERSIQNRALTTRRARGKVEHGHMRGARTDIPELWTDRQLAQLYCSGGQESLSSCREIKGMHYSN